MSIGAYTDKLRKPSDADVVRCLGRSYVRWLLLLEHLRGQVKAKQDFAFLNGREYGWALRFRLKGRLLTSLFPNDGFFTAQINLGEVHLARAGRMHLHQNALAAIERATFYAEGKWVFSPVRNDSDLKDVLKLIELKSTGTDGSTVNHVRTDKSLGLSP